MDRGSRTPLTHVLAFLERLDQAHIWYRLEHVRDSLMVCVTVPGERWEIEFFADGQIEVERFLRSGPIADASSLNALFANRDG